MRKAILHASSPAVLALIALLVPGATLASIPSLVWEEAELVDFGVRDLPSSPGPCGLCVPEESPLHAAFTHAVVYTKEGEIYLCRRGAGGWEPPERLSDDPALSRDPRIVLAGTSLLVVWEDERHGHPEVFVRRWAGGSWESESCLSLDDVPSASPVMAAGNDQALVLWVENSGLSASLRGRCWSGTAWGPVETASDPGAVVLEASAGTEPSSAGGGPFVAIWSDARDGVADLYWQTRQWNGTWVTPTKITDLAGACRRPSVHAEICCGDAIDTFFHIVFELEIDGVPEVAGACFQAYGGPLSDVQVHSAQDGIPSIRPSVHGYTESRMWGWAGGLFGRYVVTWTDCPPGVPFVHRLGYVPYCEGSAVDEEVLTENGRSISAVAMAEGTDEAPLLALWAEQGDVQSVLIARRGAMPGCTAVDLVDPRIVLVAPDGEPANELRLMDTCGEDEPVPGVAMSYWFDAAADQGVTWDATQVHPSIPPVPTDSTGLARIPIRGGGCTTSGYVYASASGVTLFSLGPGVRSPDIDGDCAVRLDDRDYVSARIGQWDFCADLDGSGLVTAADVAIVEAALGDHCAQVTAVEDPGAEDERNRRPDGAEVPLRLGPNPARSHVSLRPGVSGVEISRVVIYDAGGRVCRELGTEARMGLAREGRIEWDLRDQEGRPVAAGFYLVSAWIGGARASRGLLVVR